MAQPQAGILNRPPDHLILAAFEFLTADPNSTRTALEGLRALVSAELRSDLADTTPSSDKTQPSAETGELGFEDGFDRYHLTITLGLGKPACDKLGVAQNEQPQDLIPIPWDKLGDQSSDGSRTVVNPTNGDFVLQVCSDSVYVAEHVVRRVEHELASVVRLVWSAPGSQRHTSRAGRTNRQEGRALIGFLDGTSNLNPRDIDADRHLVFVDPEQMGDMPPRVPPTDPSQPPPYGQPTPPVFPDDLREPPHQEPNWAKNGSYVVVRVSKVDMSDWDRESLGSQEHTIGRWKVSGSALDHADDPTQPPAEPTFADADRSITPLNAHIRKANPRGPNDGLRRIFRRGYPLVTPTPDQGVTRGLVFIGFARTISSQFEFITRAWTANPNFPRPDAGVDAFRRLEAVLCGGYFFVPAIKNAHEPWSWILPPQA
jgi:deferrochelatase/peroxidase EfeB